MSNGFSRRTFIKTTAAAGGMAAYANEETSMLMAIPIWIPYALMVPGLLLTAVVSVYVAWRTLVLGDPRE